MLRSFNCSINHTRFCDARDGRQSVERLCRQVKQQSRVASELFLVAVNSGDAEAKFPRTFAAPTARLRFLLRSPNEIEQRPPAVVRIVVSRARRVGGEQRLQAPDVFRSQQTLLNSETRKIKTVRSEEHTSELQSLAY